MNIPTFSIRLTRADVCVADQDACDKGFALSSGDEYIRAEFQLSCVEGVSIYERDLVFALPPSVTGDLRVGGVYTLDYAEGE